MKTVKYAGKQMIHIVKVVQNALRKAVGQKGMTIFHHIQLNART
jgi:hypothetical protein